MIDSKRLTAAYENIEDRLLAARDPLGPWTGELATSALSTATAVSALSLVDQSLAAGSHANERSRIRELVAGGTDYLVKAQNDDDGGWGDTDKSYSNIATTMLGIAAIHLAGRAQEHQGVIARAQKFVDSRGGIDGLRARYGKDKTFAVPILTNCALAGLVSWSEVAPLPFELACLPQSWYRFARMPVVSYAIPALVAIGQAKYFHQKPKLPWMRLIRGAAVGQSLEVLRKMQPASGGFLEATPLTSFVVMSLAATGRADHPVTRLSVRFLVDSVRPDGSWPIDTNLATWNTSLTVNALAASGKEVEPLGCLEWLLSCQHNTVHPFTGAAPGGWGWSDLSGAVPDADDTPGALLALAAISDSSTCSEVDRQRIASAAASGVRWLLDIQNFDGGWPTFCRGWGKLPFDRSGADLTAHALRAIRRWSHLRFYERAEIAVGRGFQFLARSQQRDGSWIPLWFGNQDNPREENPVYGTAKVLLAYRDHQRSRDEQARRGIAWLCQNQNEDGGWGGGAAIASANNGTVTSSVEETALAVEALAGLSEAPAHAACERGLHWLCEAVESGRVEQTAPIGFYFAKLWYYERLYPLIFATAALGTALRHR